MNDEHSISHIDPAELDRLMHEVVDTSPLATCVVDTVSGHIVYANDAYVALSGRVRTDLLGAPPDLAGPVAPVEELDRLRHDLQAGKPSSATLTVADGEQGFQIVECRATPLGSAAGPASHSSLTVRVVTESVRSANLVAAETRLDELLAELVSCAEDDTTAITRLGDELAAAATTVAGFGRARVEFRDPAGRLDVVAGASTSSAEATPVIEFGLAGSTPCGAFTITELTNDTAPLIDTVGLRRLGAHGISVIAALADYHHRRRTVIDVQQQELPTRFEVEGFDVAAAYVPGTVGLHVGGDWYDIVETSSRVVFLIGDVEGHGVEAAALMGRLRVLARIELERSANIVEIASILDQACVDEGRKAGFLAVDLDRRSGRASIYSAGHPAPLIITRGNPEVPVIECGPKLGELGGHRLGSTLIDIAAGSGVVLYTDGLLRRHGGELDELAIVVGTPATARALINGVLGPDAVEGTDDVALLAFTRH